MTGLVSGGGSEFDYIQSAEPSNPQNGELWFDTDGGSDGTGEVKVYDGASGAWEVTGYTSHGDLTDVTRGAHHPPVTVSAPLTQPSDQDLELDFGDGLTTSTGTLVADLGNGLGIDANGRVYIPADAIGSSEIASGAVGATQLDGSYPDGSIAVADLSFDPATQTELDNHAGDATAHHSKPTSTQSASDTGGNWHTIASVSASDASNSARPYGPVNQLRSDPDDSGVKSCEVILADGRSYTVDSPGESTSFETGIAVKVTATSQNTVGPNVRAQVKFAPLKAHSHNI
ncbi:hypothetical protein [Halobaculum sp. EA56]|uniref:hypothetical protein n=1 Tax=Halobaculum sp. EA56 TaxID=3421648 RepID=UPI003EC0775F